MSFASPNPVPDVDPEQLLAAIVKVVPDEDNDTELNWSYWLHTEDAATAAAGAGSKDDVYVHASNAKRVLSTSNMYSCPKLAARFAVRVLLPMMKAQAGESTDDEKPLEAAASAASSSPHLESTSIHLRRVSLYQEGILPHPRAAQLFPDANKAAAKTTAAAADDDDAAAAADEPNVVLDGEGVHAAEDAACASGSGGYFSIGPFSKPRNAVNAFLLLCIKLMGSKNTAGKRPGTPLIFTSRLLPMFPACGDDVSDGWAGLSLVTSTSAAGTPQWSLRLFTLPWAPVVHAPQHIRRMACSYLSTLFRGVAVDWQMFSDMAPKALLANPYGLPLPEPSDELVAAAAYAEAAEADALAAERAKVADAAPKSPTPAKKMIDEPAPLSCKSDSLDNVGFALHKALASAMLQQAWQNQA